MLSLFTPRHGARVLCLAGATWLTALSVTHAADAQVETLDPVIVTA